MGSGCLFVIVGGIVGALCGLLGSGPAMVVVGGGHSHDDMYVPFEGALVGAVLGALLGPKVIGAGLRVLERRRVDRLNGVASPSLVPALAYFAGFVVAGFGSFASLYYSTCIAELTPGQGGPVSNTDPTVRAGASLVLAVVLCVGAAISLFRAVRSVR
jgi:hypothetical protein